MNTEIWDQIKSNISSKNQHNPALKVWLDSISYEDEIDNFNSPQIKLKVPTEYHKNWITDNLLGQICSELTKIYNNSFEVDVDVEEALAGSNSRQSEQLRFDQIGQFAQNTIPQPSIGGTGQEIHRSKDAMRPDYTFKTFVVGPNNEFAHAASYRVAENCGDMQNNPLFIFGPTGLGKTHLLNAIGNHLKEKTPQIRIAYISAEKFLNECVSGIRHKEMNRFRKRYREDCDVLLMDDIHVLGRGDAVQEEFFHTLNSFFENRRQVVVACDRMPKDIPGLEDRIRTRLEGGLIADIQMPNLETRMAILRYKAEGLNSRLSDEVVQYLARISKRSIRELEGNLNKVRMFSQLQGLPVTMELAKRVLVSHTSSSGNLTIEDIQKLVADVLKVRISDLKSKNRQKPIVTARQVAMKLVQKHLSKTLKDIGRAFGGKDHTTVLNAIRKIDSQLEKDPDLRRDYEEIEARIHNITGV